MYAAAIISSKKTHYWQKKLELPILLEAITLLERGQIDSNMDKD